VTAQTYDQSLTGIAEHSETAGVRGIALVVILVILMAVAGVVLATVEWIAPVSSVAVPG
jgi:hypothetical protein